MTRKVVVNDRMQQGYAYYRTEPVGRTFAPEFTPELTPNQMLTLGVFGRVGISACLLGDKVRVDGGHKRDAFLTETFGRFVECPIRSASTSAPAACQPGASAMAGTASKLAA